MKIDKNEIAKKIGQLENVVPKSPTMEALQGLLYEDGYLIASNNELTVKAKIEGIDEESFVIPAKAFDLISSLPNGDVNITCLNDTVTIEMGKIRNQFKTYPVNKFVYARESIEASGQASIPADKFTEAVSHVLYAIQSQSAANQIMTGMYLECSGNTLSFVGLDGRRIAWDKIDFTGDFKLIIPKAAMEKVIQLNVKGDITISYDNHGAVFKTEEYEIYTRLIEGKYYDYTKMFSEGDIKTNLNRKEFLEAINRAKLCGAVEDKAPVKLFLSHSTIQITYKNATADYSEEIPVQVEFKSELKIAFDPKLLVDCLKAFNCENISMAYASKALPAIIRATDSNMTALILPVNFKEA